MKYFLRKLLLLVLAINTICGAAAYAQSTEPLLTPFASGGAWGYVDATGKVVIAPRFHEATPFSEGVAAVSVCSKDGLPYPLTRSVVLCLWGYIDKSGAYTITPRYIAAFPFVNGVARYWTGAWTSINKYGIIDKTGREILPPQFDNILTDFFEGVAPFRIGYKWGYVDTKGEIVISARFAAADRFSEGLAPVALKNEHDVFVWGYADRSGAFLVEPRFSRVSKFSEGLAAVTDFDGKGGYIDKSGRMAIIPKFDGVGDFSDGTAQVFVRTTKTYLDIHGRRVERYKEGTINKRGRYVIRPKLQPVGH